uniref:hypothetical protein n=1 Tax=Bacteroides acidifaciens TaxID=85831 RepID=UPI00258C962A
HFVKVCIRYDFSVKLQYHKDKERAEQGLPSKLEVPVIIAFYALISLLSQDYSIILATRPEPTVLPPSRALGNEI